MITLAELRAGELGYGVLEDESKFSVEEKVLCFSKGRLEALQLGFTATSRSNETGTETYQSEEIQSVNEETARRKFKRLIRVQKYPQMSKQNMQEYDSARHYLVSLNFRNSAGNWEGDRVSFEIHTEDTLNPFSCRKLKLFHIWN